MLGNFPSDAVDAEYEESRKVIVAGLTTGAVAFCGLIAESTINRKWDELDFEGENTAVASTTRAVTAATKHQTCCSTNETFFTNAYQRRFG